MSPDPAASRLRELGVDLHSPPDELERVAREHPEVAPAAIRALSGQESEPAARALRRLEAVLREKPLRREIRRALYRLRQKGIVVPEPATKESPTRRRSILAVDADDTEGYLSAPDPFGTRILWLVKPCPGGGLWHMTATVNVHRGLRELLLGEITRKSLRSLRDEMAARHGLRLVQAPARYVDCVLSEGYETAKTHGELTRDSALFPQMRSQLFHRPAEPVPAPIAEALDQEAIRESPQCLRESTALFQEPELERWALPEELLGGHLEKAKEVRDSRIVVDVKVQRQQLEEVVRTAVDDLFGGERRAGWQRLLAELAWFFLRTDREAAARRAYACTLALGDEVTVPFLEELVRRSVAVLWREEEEREEEERESSLLLTPDQIREAKRRRRGGSR